MTMRTRSLPMLKAAAVSFDRNEWGPPTDRLSKDQFKTRTLRANLLRSIDATTKTTCDIASGPATVAGPAPSLIGCSTSAAESAAAVADSAAAAAAAASTFNCSARCSLLYEAFRLAERDGRPHAPQDRWHTANCGSYCSMEATVEAKLFGTCWPSVWSRLNNFLTASVTSFVS